MLTSVLQTTLIVTSFLGAAVCELSWFFPGNPLTGFKAAPGAPWPMPQSWQNSTSQMTLDPRTFQMTSNVPGCDVIESAIQRYGVYLNLDPDGAIDPDLPELTTLTITVDNQTCGEDFYPQYNMDESYSITIDDTAEVTLSAPTIWGAVRGLETFSQLLYLTNDKLYRINQTIINDFPRFPYRGLLIDTGRHFLPVNVILTVLDVMSWDKMNVLHWHIVDDQSFPYTSRTYPNLTKGAYSPDHIFSRENISTILYEARLRGIRVVPEFDSPGHCWSWGQGYPELLTPCWGEGLDGGPYKPNYPYHSASELMYPIQDYTYEFIGNLFREVVEDFPDQYVHLGMDGVSYNCWNSNPNISEWMDEMGYTDISQVTQYYCERVIQTVSNIGASLMLYQDPFNNGVNIGENAILEVWNQPWEDNMLSVTTAGHDAILSAPWYLNYISYGEDWDDYYIVEPYSFSNNPNLQQHVKGGEACMWGEYIDGTNIFSTTWPRASTVAERLWSDQSVNDPNDAKYRLDQQRCRMDRRRIPAQPLMNSYCGDYEWTY